MLLDKKGGIMRRCSFFLIFLFLSCAHTGSTYITDETECKGGFIPGEEAFVCELYDVESKLLERIEISKREKNKCYFNGYAFYVRCLDGQEKPIWPKIANTPLCSFIGNKPSCPKEDAQITK